VQFECNLEALREHELAELVIEQHDVAVGAVFVQRGTHVAILAQDTAARFPVPIQVQVLDGERAGSVGWVTGCWLNPPVACGRNP